MDVLSRAESLALIEGALHFQVLDCGALVEPSHCVGAQVFQIFVFGRVRGATATGQQAGRATEDMGVCSTRRRQPEILLARPAAVCVPIYGAPRLALIEGALHFQVLDCGALVEPSHYCAGFGMREAAATGQSAGGAIEDMGARLSRRCHPEILLACAKFVEQTVVALFALAVGPLSLSVP